MDTTQKPYPDETLAAIVRLILAGFGPVAIARSLGVSRPTANRMIAAACERSGIPRPRRAKATTGEHKRVAKAQRMIAQGKTNRAIYKDLGVSRWRGERILEKARDLATTTLIIHPAILEGHFAASLDVMAEIGEVNGTLRALADLAKNQLLYLIETTTFDTGPDHENLAAGWHKRQGNVLQAIDTIRKLQESILKAIGVHQAVVVRMLDMQKLTGFADDLSGGIRDGLAELKATGLLACSMDEGAAVISRATKARIGRRKGIA